MSRSVIFVLPVPPSTNNLFPTVARRSKKGNLFIARVRSSAYTKWSQEAGWRVKIKMASRSPFEGTVGIYIRCRRPNKQSDIDNRGKAILDLLGSGKHGMSVIKDDKFVTRLVIEWADIEECEVTVTEDSEPA